MISGSRKIQSAINIISVFVSSPPPHTNLLAFTVITADLSLGGLLWNCPHSVLAPRIVRRTSAGGGAILPYMLETHSYASISELISFIGSLYNWLYSLLVLLRAVWIHELFGYARHSARVINNSCSLSLLSAMTALFLFLLELIFNLGLQCCVCDEIIIMKSYNLEEIIRRRRNLCWCKGMAISVWIQIGALRYCSLAFGRNQRPIHAMGTE